jgi:hypothetical protein
MYGNNNFSRKPMAVTGFTKTQWRPIERKLKGNVVVEVTELPLPVPKYSFKIGTAKIDDNGQIIDIQPFLSIYNVHDAADLLRSVGDKYLERRETRQDEMDTRQRFTDEDPFTPTVTPNVRRTRNP